jgi:hypothetical protein
VAIRVACKYFGWPGHLRPPLSYVPVTPELTVTISQDAFNVEIHTTPQNVKNPEMNLPNVHFTEPLTQLTTGAVNPIRIS